MGYLIMGWEICQGKMEGGMKLFIGALALFVAFQVWFWRYDVEPTQWGEYCGFPLV